LFIKFEINCYVRNNTLRNNTLRFFFRAKPSTVLNSGKRNLVGKKWTSKRSNNKFPIICRIYSMKYPWIRLRTRTWSLRRCEQFRRCGRCEITHYCSVDAHKKMCRKVKLVWFLFSQNLSDFWV